VDPLDPPDGLDEPPEYVPEPLPEPLEPEEPLEPAPEPELEPVSCAIARPAASINAVRVVSVFMVVSRLLVGTKFIDELHD